MTTTLHPNASSVSLAYVPISHDIAERARRTRRDDFGHALDIRKEFGPCRVCLRVSTEPEDFLLMSYRPLRDSGPYAEIGPVFIHARECAPYATPEIFPADFACRDLVLRAYNAAGEIVDAAVAKAGEHRALAASFLSDPHIEEVHVRHTSYTCYDFKILRM
ncbi:MAG: DUF1203 domain-containing protein [Candidatus Eremiobacteraeota bacterium]|nr:DUF1203 domain-containing protein [Candidatus Eremiobacteraeota bacterium]